MDRKHTIDTGLYSDYAMDLLNNLRESVMQIGYKRTVNHAIYSILKDLPSHIELYMPQKYGFDHVANGEVCLVDVEVQPNKYFHFGFTDNRKYLNLIALQLKEIALLNIDNKAKWHRHDFDCKVQIGNSEYPIAELYFIYDFFWNHMKSVNAFKRTYPDVANKIIGSPRDPIITEFIEMSNKKTKELWRDYYKNLKDLEFSILDDLEFSIVQGNWSTKADRELSTRIKNLCNAFKAECEQQKVALKKKLQEDLARCEVPKEMLVSNSI